MKPVNRRNFLKTSAQVAAAATVAGPAYGVTGANEKIRVACVGVNGRGFGHAREFLKLKGKGVDVVALCDIDERVLERRRADVGKLRGGAKPDGHVDIRKLLADKSIDAISVATTNHWHALATVWGCQAGKDVYVEKPVSWCIREGRRMVEAARKYKRIVQVGQQHRSNAVIRRAAAQLRAGIIGDVYMSRSLVFRKRESIGTKPPTTPPKHVHYDLWLGPARKQPYHENLVHYKWHWFWDFGNGEIGNNGIHAMDLARMALGKTLPIKVSSMGGRFGYDPKDQAETPNTQTAMLTYEDGTMMVCDIRNRHTNTEPNLHANLFFGSLGYWAGTAPKFGDGNKPYGGKAAPEIDTKCLGGTGKPNHFENFVDAMRNRKVEDLNCDILEGHLSAVLFHMANISYRVGKTLTFDPKTEMFVGDGAKEANPYVTRDYREPFVVPEQV